MGLSYPRRLIALIAMAVLAFAGAGALTATPGSADGGGNAEGTSQVFVVHGIPGQPVDVYVNGALTLEDFQPGTVAGPLTLNAGSYDLALTRPGEPIGQAIVTADDVQVPGGANISVVAHLTAGGQPTITPYVNDVSKVPAGKARLIVRHDAAAPAVDVRADGAVVFGNLTNPNEAKADVAAGTVSADVTLAGTDQVVLGPQEVNLAEGTVTILYAVGSAADNTLSLISQTLPGHGTAPGGVPAGDGGQAGSGGTAWWYVLAGAGVLLLVGGAARLAPRRPVLG